MHALCVRSDVDGWGWMFSSPGLPLPPSSDSSPPARSWGEEHSGPTGLKLVSYSFHQALGSRSCGCSLAVVLCLLVSLLGLVVFVVVAKIYMFLGGDSHCPSHAAILAPPCRTTILTPS